MLCTMALPSKLCAALYGQSNIGSMGNYKVSKGAKIRNRYNQVPHLTQDTNGKVTNSQLDTTNENHEVSPFSCSGTLKDKKYSSLSLKLELKGLVKPETASSTYSFFFASEQNEYFISVH